MIVTKKDKIKKQTKIKQKFKQKTNWISYSEELKKIKFA